MNNTIKKMIKGMVISVILLISINVLAQESIIEEKRLHRDMRIMGGILGKLIAQEENTHYPGYYIGMSPNIMLLKGFGIVFYTHKSSPLTNDFLFGGVTRNMKTSYSKTLENFLVMQYEEKSLESKKGKKSDIDSTEIKMLQKENEAIETLKDNIICFFKKYVPAIRQLKDDDRIAIIVKLDNWRNKKYQDSFLKAMVTKQAVDLYRKNRISYADFQKRIVFQLREEKSDITKDIDIMSEILSRGLDSSTYWRPSSYRGTYMENFGVIFFLNIPSRFLTLSIVSTDTPDVVLTKTITNSSKEYQTSKEEIFDLKGKLITITEKEKKKKKDREKEINKSIKELQDELFDLLASYGHTLRIKPEEWVVLNVNMGNNLFYPRNSDNSHFILQIKKKYLDYYYKGTITIDELRKKLIVQTI